MLIQHPPPPQRPARLSPPPARPETAEKPPDSVSLNPVGTIVGGAAGLIGAGLGAYAGSLGGAVVGSALGGGVGVVLGALAHSSPLGWVSTSFATAGTLGRVGIVLGAGAGVVGGWSIAQRLGGPKETAPTQEPPQGVAKAVAAGVAGTGLLAGATGGFLGAAGLVGAGKVAAGWLAGNLSWAAAGHAALVAGAVGAVAMGTAGAMGGWKLFRELQWTADKVRQAAPRVLEWAKKFPQNGIVTGALVGAATLTATGAMARLPFPMVGPAAAGVLGHGVGFGVGRALTTPLHRDVLTFAHCMAIGGVVSMFSATSILPLPANLLARAALGAVGGGMLGAKIAGMRRGLE